MSRLESVEDGTIWRYMDLAKFVSTLESGLFFAVPSALGDDWEGAWGAEDVAEFRRRNEALSLEDMQTEFDTQFDSRRAELEMYGVSCWHRSDSESPALWSLYAARGLGVALISSVSRVRTALRDRAAEIRDVRYTDYSSARLGEDPVDLLSHKRAEFEHEKEVRFIVRFNDAELDAIEGWRRLEQLRSKRSVRHGFPGPMALPVDSLTGLDHSRLSAGSPSGVHLATNMETVIQQVRLVPNVSYELRRAVGAVLKANALPPGKFLQESDMERRPPDQLRFHEG